MKKNLFKTLCFAAIALFTAFSLNSCKTTEPEPDPEVLLDGFYVSGDATAFSAVTIAGQLKSTTVENDNNSARVGLNEIYIALEANKTFTLTEVSGATKMVYGPGAGFASVVQVAGDDEMGATIQKGKYASGGTFTVPTSGLYHVIIDKQTTTVVILPVASWAIIGGATPLGWSDNVMDAKGAFSKDSMVFEIKDLTLLAGDFKFRHSGAWKQTIVATPLIKVNTNFGGTSMTTLVPGGANIPLVKADNGKYTVTARWTKDKGMKITMMKTGIVVVAEYPANLYMIGSSIGGWDWTGAYIIKMNPVHSHPNAFWAIAYIDAPATDPGFKFSPVKDWAGDFGVTGTATNGVYAKGGTNLTVATAGYYMVYVDLKAEKISVTVPTVYGIGDAFGGYTKDVLANKFVVDNTAKTITSPATTAAGNLRMYATCPLSQLDTPIADWWQMEFNVIAGKIEYRGAGGDQAAVPVTVGKKAVLNFKTGVASIQ
ncbi:MAG: SusF/SusE family outer membrane protein [Paludibacter sp.]|nr:SusF/SusE family outer membrane protein [Paludibacter sp.]